MLLFAQFLQLGNCSVRSCLCLPLDPAEYKAGATSITSNMPCVYLTIGVLLDFVEKSVTPGCLQELEHRSLAPALPQRLVLQHGTVHDRVQRHLRVLWTHLASGQWPQRAGTRRHTTGATELSSEVVGCGGLWPGPQERKPLWVGGCSRSSHGTLGIQAQQHVGLSLCASSGFEGQVACHSPHHGKQGCPPNTPMEMPPLRTEGI